MQPSLFALVINNERFLKIVNAITETHKELVLRSVDGDQFAQAELYRHYAKAMYNVCIRMMQNREDAEDVLQESFVTAFLRLHTFRFESSFGSWLKRIVINHCINTLKKARLDLSFLDDLSFFNMVDEDDSFSEEDINYSISNVKRAMDTLPDGSKMVFNLYLFEGYDHKEIADILSITETTSKTQFMRAKRKVAALVHKNNLDYEEHQNG